MMENEGMKKNGGELMVIYKGERLESIDGVRAVAILAIVVCHVCYGFSGESVLGQYLGGTFNYVFLFISAYLFGLKHAAKPEVWGGNSCVVGWRAFAGRFGPFWARSLWAAGLSESRCRPSGW